MIPEKTKNCLRKTNLEKDRLKRKYDGLYQIRLSVNRLLTDIPHAEPWIKRIQIALFLIIIINSLMVVLITVPWIQEEAGDFINLIIAISLFIFTIEYILRVWSCTHEITLRARMHERIRFILNPYSIIDLIAILPVFLPFLVLQNLAVLRLVRVFSVFKFMRYARHFESLIQLERIFFRTKEIFAIMGFFLIFVLLFSSTIMYLLEHHAQPEEFSSIPAAMWWAIMTVTTVGYGDIIPITPLGRIFAGFVTIGGMIILALPGAILAAGFIEERTKKIHVHEESDKNENFHKITTEVVLIERVHRLKKEGVLTDLEMREYIEDIRALRS